MCAKIYCNRSVIKCPTELQWKKPSQTRRILFTYFIYFFLFAKNISSSVLSVFGQMNQRIGVGIRVSDQI